MLLSSMKRPLISLKTLRPLSVSMAYWVVASSPPVASGAYSSTSGVNSLLPTSRSSMGLPTTLSTLAVLCWSSTRIFLARPAMVFEKAPGSIRSPPSSTLPRTATKCCTTPVSSSTSLMKVGSRLRSKLSNL